MDLLLPIISIVGGFALLILGGDWLVLSSISLACRMRISPAVIGLTIIAAGTSLPELITSLMASAKDSPDIAIGNVVGSNIFNLLAILGIASIFRPNKVSQTQIRLEIPFILFCSVLLYIFTFNGELNRYEAMVFLTLFVTFISYSVIRSRKNYAIEVEEQDESIETLKHLAFDIGYLVIGLIALLGGAHFALDGSIQVARLFGLSERFIGLTIIAVGTGLPELATSTIAALRGRPGIAIGNVIGSNLFNILMVLGITGTVKSINIHPHILAFDIPWMMASTFVLIPAYFIGRREFKRPMGITFLVGYISYLMILTFSQ